MIELVYEEAESWPPLAWVADCRPAQSAVFVRHGSGVETREQWFAEAVWDGAFESGSLDQTDLVFGSGARVRDGTVVFVPSTATVDRLHTLRHDAGFLVANTLPGLLAVAAANLDPTFTGYYDLIGTICLGIENYERALPTSKGTVRFAYHHNLRYQGHQLREVPKPMPRYDLSVYRSYRRMLQQSALALTRNLASRQRQFPLRNLATLSTGYDSPAVAAVAHEAGVEHAITLDSSRTGESDDGTDIGRMLGYQTTRFSTAAWRKMSGLEVPFFAADAKGQDVVLAGAGDLLAGKLLWTGFQGGWAWDRRPPTVETCLRRRDRSGLSLTEFRLWKGFLHAPMPFIGLRQMPDIHSVTASAEMQPFSVGGPYDKPIARRIVEESGVAREMFGTRKKAPSCMFIRGCDTITPEASADLMTWLEERRDAWSTRGLPHPLVMRRAMERVAPLHAGAVAVTRQLARGPLFSTFERVSDSIDDLRTAYRFAFPWAVDRAKQRYQPVS